MNYKILLLPTFRSPSDAYQALARMAIYCGPFRQDIGMITALYRGRDFLDLDLSGFFENPSDYLPAHFCSDMNDTISSFNKQVRVLPDETGLLNRTMQENFELVYCWSEKQPKDMSHLQRFIDTAKADVVHADPAKYPDEIITAIRGIERLSVSLKGLGLGGMSDEARTNQSRGRFVNIMEAAQGRGVTLFGPSAATADETSLRPFTDDRYKIICDELVGIEWAAKIIQPDLVCLTDYDRMVGSTKMAAQFRSGLKALLSETSCQIVCDSLAQTYLNQFLPALLHSRLISVPRDAGDINIALDRSFRTQVTAGHSLTAFMLPIAMTLSKDIAFFGFTGTGAKSEAVSESPAWWGIDREISTFVKAGQNRGTMFRNGQGSGLPSLAQLGMGEMT